MMHFMMKMMPRCVKRLAISRRIRYSGTLRYLMMAAIMLTFFPTETSASADNNDRSFFKKLHSRNKSSFTGWGKLKNFFFRSKTFYFALAVIILMISSNFLGVSNGDEYGASDILRAAIKVGGAVFLGFASTVALYRLCYIGYHNPATVGDWRSTKENLKTGDRYYAESFIKTCLNYGVPFLMIALSIFILTSGIQNGAIKTMTVLPSVGLGLGGFYLLSSSWFGSGKVANFFDGKPASPQNEELGEEDPIDFCGSVIVGKITSMLGTEQTPGQVAGNWFQANWKSCLLILTCIIALSVAANHDFGDEKFSSCGKDYGSSQMFRMAIMIPSGLLLLGTVCLQIHKGVVSGQSCFYKAHSDNQYFQDIVKAVVSGSMIILGIAALACTFLSGGGNDTAGLILLTSAFLGVGGYQFLKNVDKLLDSNSLYYVSTSVEEVSESNVSKAAPAESFTKKIPEKGGEISRATHNPVGKIGTEMLDRRRRLRSLEEIVAKLSIKN